MWLYLEPFLVGLLVGAIFKFLHLPIPAPGTFAGILGVVGLFLGYMLIK